MGAGQGPAPQLPGRSLDGPNGMPGSSAPMGGMMGGATPMQHPQMPPPSPTPGIAGFPVLGSTGHPGTPAAGATAASPAALAEGLGRLSAGGGFNRGMR